MTLRMNVRTPLWKLLAAFLLAVPARADICQWAWVDPSDHRQGKRRFAGLRIPVIYLDAVVYAGDTMGVPALLRRTLATTNPIESAFSVAQNVTRRVRCWREGDMRQR
jgi:hypothetical protein